MTLPRDAIGRRGFGGPRTNRHEHGATGRLPADHALVPFGFAQGAVLIAVIVLEAPLEREGDGVARMFLGKVRTEDHPKIVGDLADLDELIAIAIEPFQLVPAHGVVGLIAAPTQGGGAGVDVLFADGRDRDRFLGKPIDGPEFATRLNVVRSEAERAQDD